MKKKVMLRTPWVVLFLLMVGCSLADEEPLPTLVPVIQLPESTQAAPVEETAVSAEPPNPSPTPTTEAASPATTFDNRGAIVFINSAGEGLYLTRPNGSEQIQFYALQNIEQLLPASFNGQRIGLIREGQLYIARTDGAGMVEVTAVANPFWLSWSPTRDEFALIDNGDLVVVQADSAAVRRLTTGMQLANLPGSVAWSPDGNQLLFTCGTQATDLCRVASAGGEETINITNNGTDSFAWYREPRWSPNGSQISYVSPDENKDLQLFVMDVESNEVRQLTLGSGQNSLHSWSPDGQYIAYANFADGAWRALVIAADGTDSKELSSELPKLEAIIPQWDQDGTQISLLYTTEAAADVVAAAVVSVGETAVTPITDDGWQLQWSAEGRQIAYLSAGAQIYVQGISASGTGSPSIIDCPSGCESFVWLP